MDGWLAGWMAGWVKDGQLGVGGQMSGWTDGLEDSSAVATWGPRGHTGAAGQAGSGLLKPGHCLLPGLLLVSRPLSREGGPHPWKQLWNPPDIGMGIRGVRGTEPS